jgi:DNA mismatch repair protein MutS2
MRTRSRRLARRPAAGPVRFYVEPVGKSPSSEGPEVVDLLHVKPCAWGDLRGSAELVRFAFEGGDCATAFDTLVEALPLSPTDLSADTFASQLHLDQLIESCLHIKIDGNRLPLNNPVLRRILQSPPLSADDCHARQNVLSELVGHSNVRTDLEQLYLAVRALRETLEVPASTEPSTIRRKLDVLLALQRSINAMADGFEDSSSVLSRLRERGRKIRETEAWSRLVRFIDIEGNLATIDLRLRLGSDGTLRVFEIVSMDENQTAGLWPGPLWRFVQRMVGFFRGHRYGESEVVTRLLDEVFSPLSNEVVSLLALIGSLEFYLSCMGFHDIAREHELKVSLAEISAVPLSDSGESNGAITEEHKCIERRIEGLFNPLLFLQGVKPIPCSPPVVQHDALVVLTGPNSGGKTRFLQAIAFTQLLGQVGMFVPASRAVLVRAPKLFLSLVTDDDATQVEGRLGTELLRIRKLFEQLEPGSMALLDELCSGTNPTEGEAIFEMVVSLLPRLGPQVFVSTHFLSFAARLERERPIESLSFLKVDLDAMERPTYQFVPGVATTSLAHKVAARLGVTREDLCSLVDEKLRKPNVVGPG